MPEIFDQSALRHFEDAETLTSGGRFDGAGHLLGFAVECAIKHAVMSLRPSMGAPHVHLPHLIEKAKKTIQGRRKHSIHKLLERPNFMSGWDIGHRYSADGTVDEAQLRAWRDDASRTISAAGIRRVGR